MNINLKTIEILDDFEGPNLLLCRDVHGLKYLASNAFLRGDLAIFYATPIFPGRLKSLKAGKICVRDVFESPELPVFLEITTTWFPSDEFAASPAEFMEMPRSLLPAPNYRLLPGDEDLSAQSAIQEMLQGISSTSRSGGYQYYCTSYSSYTVESDGVSKSVVNSGDSDDGIPDIADKILQAA